jgi:hypothetical protein
VSQTEQPPYEFENLPLEPVPPGTNLLVTGPAMGGLRELMMRLLACESEEGLLVLALDVDADETIENFERGGCLYDPSRMAVIDCTQSGAEDDGRNVYSVSAPSDLTGMGIQFSSLYEQLYEAGFRRVRTGLYTVSTLFMYTDEVQPLYRFLHTMTGRVRSAEGLGISAVDPETMDEQTFRTLTQPFDGELQLREQDGGHELRIRGLSDQPDGWQSFEL